MYTINENCDESRRQCWEIFRAIAQPALIGTPAQCDWAKSIRNQCLAEAFSIRIPPQIWAEFLSQKTSAKWWIEHRSQSQLRHVFFNLRDGNPESEMPKYVEMPLVRSRQSWHQPTEPKTPVSSGWNNRISRSMM
jgi:hypothetical protein